MLGFARCNSVGTYRRPIIVEDRLSGDAAGANLSFRDEIYQMRNYSRDKLRVLMRLMPAGSNSVKQECPSHQPRLCRDLGKNVR
jgi:hypothetical protein